MSTVAVIPARGGSKRIPRKNIRDFCGRPIIAWSIQAALESACFDRVIVSTDDDEIAEVARAWGADIPFDRPESLADDHAGTVPVVQHALTWLAEHDRPVETICCLYATAPFVSATDLREGQSIFEREHCDFALTVTEFSSPIQRALRVTSDGRLSMFHPEQFDTRSQDLESAYHDAGQFYWGRAGAWQAGAPLFGPYSAPIVLPGYRVQDIDTADDWQRAEHLFRALREQDK